jgi:PERQ amino acid-rich with GYF domain-containing protein
VDNLQHLGLDPDVLTEAVHFASTTIDSRHFTEEFIRRHKLAEKGIAPEPSASLPSATGGAGGTAAGGGAASNNGGWSEVAKKGSSGQTQDKDGGGASGNFRVVQGKRRGGRR